MGTLKLAVWIGVLYIIQNNLYPILTISGIVPDLLFGFALSYSAIEPKFRKVSPVVLICAVLGGTGTGRIFPVTVLMTGIGGMVSYHLSEYLRFIPQIIRTHLVVAIFAFLMCSCEYFATAGTVTYEFLIHTAIWYTLYTTAVSVIIYLILKKIILNKDTKLLIQERN